MKRQATLLIDVVNFSGKPVQHGTKVEVTDHHLSSYYLVHDQYGKELAIVAKPFVRLNLTEDERLAIKAGGEAVSQ